MAIDRPRWRLLGPATMTSAAALLAVLVVGPTVPTRAAYTATVTNSVDSVSTVPYFRCHDAVSQQRDDLVLLWPMLDYRTGLEPDQTPQANDGTYQGATRWERTDPIACRSDNGGAYVLDGSTSWLASRVEYPAPTDFSIELWFRTTVPNGKLIGFESERLAPGNAYDRHLYLTADGRVAFGTYDAASTPQRRVVTSPGSVTDGRWHHVAGTVSSSAGATLWLDGTAVADDRSMRAPDVYRGYWRVGQGTLDNWPGRDGYEPAFFTGALRYAAVTQRPLTANEVRTHWDAGR